MSGSRLSGDYRGLDIPKVFRAEVLRRILDLDPSNRQVKENLGRLLRQQGRTGPS